MGRTTPELNVLAMQKAASMTEMSAKAKPESFRKRSNGKKQESQRDEHVYKQLQYNNVFEFKAETNMQPSSKQVKMLSAVTARPVMKSSSGR